jgi:hypothetical protein
MSDGGIGGPMMVEETLLPPVTDRSPFSLHPEDWVTQQDSHDEQTAYFKHSLRLLLPDCFVARDMAVYWVPGQTRRPYVGPDLFVSRHQPRVEDPKAWLTYEDGPLSLVIEVASDATRAKEGWKRDRRYARALQVPEYLYVDLQRDELRLGLLTGGRYEWVEPDAAGRLWSPEFGFGLVWQEGERLVRLLGPDGRVIPTGQEEAALRTEEEARRQVAEQRADREARRADREARRAEQEASRREAAETQAAELAAEIERLRRALDGAQGGGGPVS